MSQFESQFEQDLYHARLAKLEKIADLATQSTTTNPGAPGPASGTWEGPPPPPAQLTPSRAEARYPNHFRFFPPDITIPDIHHQYDPIAAEQLEADLPAIAIAGRVVAIRLQGKAGFAQLQQGGQRLQLYVRKDNVGETIFELYKLLDLGDHIGVRGTLMRTRTGELTLKVHAVDLPAIDTPQPGQPKPNTNAIQFLAKAMLPLPDKYSGLGDIELRYRRRYLDLFTDTGDTPSSEPATTLSSRPEAERSGDAAERPAVPATDLSSRPEAERSGDAAERPAVPATDLSSRPEAERSGDAAERPAVSSQDAPTRLPARAVFVKRAAILRSIRNFFDTRGYLEVETPMLHTIAGGAAARPFKTHHNALDIPLSLRIAPELYLKRLVVGGLDRVYEINRNFRNEGVSTQHNPEFTMLEFYQAYANYHDLMDLTQELITTVAKEVNGTTITFNGTEIDLSKWTKLSMREAIIKFWPPNIGRKPAQADFATEESSRDWYAEVYNLLIVPSEGTDEELETPRQLLAGKIRGLFHTRMTPQEIRRWGTLTLPVSEPVGKQIASVFEIVAEPHLIQPTIIYDFPLAVSPLSKIKPDEPDWVERFEFYIGGFEVGNAFSELNDPEDQHRRFQAQLKERDRGDDEAHAMDEDYVRALGYGLPPTAGEGIGIDRLTMILTGSRSIRDVILFPLMRPHTAPTPGEAPTSEDPSSEDPS